jgi:hypothetical protein
MYYVVLKIIIHIRAFSPPYLDPPKSGGKNTQKPQKTPFFEKPHEVPWKMAKNPKNTKKPQKWPKTQKT